MPLFDDEWSRCKAGYKLLLYMASGCIGIASKVGINDRIIEDGKNGFLARADGRDWQAKISYVIANYASIAPNIRASARQKVTSEYSVDHCYPLFLSLLRDVAREKGKQSNI
jgi:glycosyltransferase involved in cell wall biosynthesis